MRLLDLYEADSKQLKAQVIGIIQKTDDTSLLNKVLITLKRGDFVKDIEKVIANDQDTKKYLDRIANIIVNLDRPLEEKEEFLRQYERGYNFINTSKLLDGQQNPWSSFVKTDFALALFKELVPIVDYGLGAGELAFTCLSPKIKHVGKASGGGDIIVDGVKVEIKGSGGRWHDHSKAKYNLGGIERALKTAVEGKDIELPRIINAKVWVDTVRPEIKEKAPKKLHELCVSIAKNLFPYLKDTNAYQDALEFGDVTDIIKEHLNTGFESYKTYANFDGILMLSQGSEKAQYFEDFLEAADDIKSGTPYIYYTDNRAMMPDVYLKGEGKSGGKKSSAGQAAAATSAAAGLATGADIGSEVIGAKAEKTQRAAEKGVGRKKA